MLVRVAANIGLLLLLFCGIFSALILWFCLIISWAAANLIYLILKSGLRFQNWLLLWLLRLRLFLLHRLVRLLNFIRLLHLSLLLLILLNMLAFWSVERQNRDLYGNFGHFRTEGWLIRSGLRAIVRQVRLVHSQNDRVLVLIDWVNLVWVLFLRQVVLWQVVLLYRGPPIALTPLEGVLLRRLLWDLLV